MSTLPSTLTDAIEKAVETHKEEVARLPQDLSQVPVQSESPEEALAEKPMAEAQAPEVDQDAENGRLLVQALRDPEKSRMVIDYLARSAGYTPSSVETKTDVKDAKKDITSIFQKHLGDEFGFFAPKLGPAIQEILEGYRTADSDLQDVKARLDRAELGEIQRETAKEHKSIAQEYFGKDDMPDNVVAEMSKAMDRFPPSNPNISPSEYYRDIFTYVAGKLSLSKPQQTTRARQQNVPERLESSSKGVVPSITASPRKMSLHDAVRSATEQVERSIK
jgi:hypothetical protein